MNVLVSSSPFPRAHPPRSNPFLRSSSVAPPFPCITPSTVTCVMVVSFIDSSVLSEWPFSLRPHRGADLIGRGFKSHHRLHWKREDLQSKQPKDHRRRS